MSEVFSMEVVNFQKEMRRVEKEVSQMTNLELDDRIDYATDTLKVVTPVDTGRARRGWRNIKKYDTYGFRDGTISNEVEYIDVLNNGHSRQAPRYFIEQVLMKIGILIP